MSPFRGLLQSRKFWLVVIDAVTALVGLFAANFWPDRQEFIISFWAALQPVFVAAIVGIAWEDSAAKKAGVHPSQVNPKG